MLGNIAESKAAREVSNFPVLTAKEAQLSVGYNIDNWNMTTLNKGDLVYGGLPGQSAYYTSENTLLASDYNRTHLFQSLQVRPDPVRGYRPEVGVYQVGRDMRVPTGSVIANPHLGIGGGDQFLIKNFDSTLKLVNRIKLEESYEFMSTYRPGR